jgi:hypothetical protein
MKYHYSPSRNEFYMCEILNESIDDAIEITAEQFNQYDKPSIDKKTVYKNGEFSFVDKYTKKELAKIAQDKLIADAKSLLAENDYRWSNQIRWNNYTDAERQALTTYYNALLAVVNGESSTLPTLEN